MFDPLSSPNPFASSAGSSAPVWPAPPDAQASSSSSPPPPPLQSANGLRTPTGFNGREPHIYGAPEPGLISPAITTATNGAKYERTDPYLRVRITALDHNRRDILIKFDAQTNLQNWTGTAYRNVSRSYLEFQQFYEHIVATNPQTIIPALPLAQTSAPSDEEDDRLVKIMLQRWMTRVCDDAILLQDDELRSFIESDFGYQPTVRARRKTSTGFSLFKTPVPDEDETLMRARFELTRLETQFFDAAKAIDKLARARKALSVAHAEMGNKLINVATTEVHVPLGNAMRKLGRTWHILGDLDQAQAISECVILGDSLGYQGLNAKSAKETLLQRSLVLEEHQAAVKNTINKRRQIERMKGGTNIRPDRVDEALEDLEEASKYEQIITRRVDGISQNLHRALQTHSRLAHEDIQTALIEHARSALVYERQFLKELESLRPDMRNAASRVPESARVVPIAPVAPTPTRPSAAYTPAPTTPSAVRTPVSAAPSAAFSARGPNDPLSPVSPSASSSSAAGNGHGDPLRGSQSMFISPTRSEFGDATRTIGPLGPPLVMQQPPPGLRGADSMNRANTLARSVQVQPTRSRLDAREAAAKLANFL